MPALRRPGILGSATIMPDLDGLCRIGTYRYAGFPPRLLDSGPCPDGRTVATTDGQEPNPALPIFHLNKYLVSYMVAPSPSTLFLRASREPSLMSRLATETVTSVHHWTDMLFSFTTTRAPSFRFLNGQFTMIGLEVEGRPLLRAYSMASANHEEQLEFFSIKVPDGPLTSRLQHLKVGDRILVNAKPTGTLIHDNLLPGRRLYLLGTGTGLAPFLSIIKDPETYSRYEKVVLVHGCRQISELAYGEFITRDLPQHEFLGECVREQLVYYPTVTREPFRNRSRITDLIISGKLSEEVGCDPISPEHDRVMLCGSPSMLQDLVGILHEKGFEEGNHSEPGHYVIEMAFV
jgi:ferredoxin--NADP+ reductase